MGLLKDISPKPGVVKDETERAAKGRWTDSDRIRFVRGLPQKIGGWTKRYASSTFTGVCRGMHAWIDNSDLARLALGTNNKLTVVEGETFYNITPIRATASLSNPFDVVDGSPTVTVNDTAHGGRAGDYVEIDGASAVGGITPDGNYPIATVVDDDSYTITHGSNATSTVSGGGGASVTIDYEIFAGRADGEQGSGWGVGSYNEGSYGDARSSFITLEPRAWSLDQWGQYLIACPRDGSIYEWQLSTGARAQALANAPTNNLGCFVTEEQHLVALGAGGERLRVDWSDQSDNTTWSPSDQNTAGQRYLKGGSKILAGLPTRGTNLIFTDAGVWTMTFIGGLDVFAFDQVAVGAAGIIAPRAVAESEGIAYWMGQSDFYLFDGIVRPIPNSKDIRRFVLDNVTDLQKSKVSCGLNTAFSEVWWLYPTARRSTATSSTTGTTNPGTWAPSSAPPSSTRTCSRIRS